MRLPCKTTLKERRKAFSLILKMLDEGYSEDFAYEAFMIASVCQGTFDTMEMLFDDAHIDAKEELKVNLEEAVKQWKDVDVLIDFADEKRSKKLVPRGSWSATLCCRKQGEVQIELSANQKHISTDEILEVFTAVQSLLHDKYEMCK